MVLFALSCFGLLTFLWLTFGGATPLKPKGYRVTVPFKEAGQLAVEADVRISGVPVGKVKKINILVFRRLSGKEDWLAVLELNEIPAHLFELTFSEIK